VFADVQTVMEPKPPAADAPAEPPKEEASLLTLYGPYVAANFSLARETTHWKVHRRLQPSTRIGCIEACTGGSSVLVWAAAR
jgi:hypothetical protein